MTNGFEKSHLEMEALRVATTHEIAAFRFSMKSDFDEFRVSLHRLFLKWFGALISSCVALFFFLIQHLQK